MKNNWCTEFESVNERLSALQFELIIGFEKRYDRCSHPHQSYVFLLFIIRSEQVRVEVVGILN